MDSDKKVLSEEAKSRLVACLPASETVRMLWLRSGSIEIYTRQNEIIWLWSNEFGDRNFFEPQPLYPTNQFHEGRTISGVTRMIALFKQNGVELLNTVLTPVIIDNVVYDDHFLALKENKHGYIKWLTVESKKWR